MKQVRMWIGGTRSDAHGGGVRKLVNPATGEPSIYVPEAGPPDVRSAAQAARNRARTSVVMVCVIIQHLHW